MASWVSVSLVMRSSFGFSRQLALSPRQPRGGSGGERRRGGGQPQGCRSHHEQCLPCAHSPVLSGADPQNWRGDWISPPALSSGGGPVRPGTQSVRTCLQRGSVQTRGKIACRGGEKPAAKARTGAG